MKNKKGVILVGIAKSGEILAAVSSPDFRPDLFTGRMSENEWQMYFSILKSRLLIDSIRLVPSWFNCEDDYSI